MAARKAAGRLHLPEGARARLEKVLVELSLVEAAVPPRGVQKRQGVAALAHAHHGRFFLAKLARVQFHCAYARRQSAVDPLPFVRTDLHRVTQRHVPDQRLARVNFSRLNQHSGHLQTERTHGNSLCSFIIIK